MKKSLRDPLGDYLDLQQHRYDPGYWATGWIGRERTRKGKGYSAASRAFLLTLLLEGLVVVVLAGIGFDFAHGWWLLGLPAPFLYVAFHLLMRRLLARQGSPVK